MSPWSLIFWLPDLKGHCLCENMLGQLMLNRGCSFDVLDIVIYNMDGLKTVSIEANVVMASVLTLKTTR